MKVCLTVLVLLALAVAATLAGCAGGTSTSLGTAAPTTSSTAGPTTIPVGSMSTDTTVLPVTTGAIPGPHDPNRPTTTVFTGATLTAGDQEIPLTFVGPMTAETWKALRAAVNGAGGDGDRVRARVARLSAGPDVNVTMAELDRFSGIGFTAGANTTQPIGVATDADGRSVLVYSFTIRGDPDSTTIVGFDRETGHVGLAEGPLKVDDSTRNITTVPGQ